MKFSIITLFPEVFYPILQSSILGRAQKKGLVKFELINLRDFGRGPHKTVDDKPFGGGVGMVLKVDVLSRALKKIQTNKSHIILMSASGTPFKHVKAKQLSKLDHIVLVCGHYEGVDERFVEKYVDEEISIGDYVLTGGEIPSLVAIDSIVRLVPGVLEKVEATQNDSFENHLLEYPQYTRPANFEGVSVPEVLLSGDHQQIKNWKKCTALEKTKKVRPDLMKNN